VHDAELNVVKLNIGLANCGKTTETKRRRRISFLGGRAGGRMFILKLMERFNVRSVIEEISGAATVFYRAKPRADAVSMDAAWTHRAAPVRVTRLHGINLFACNDQSYGTYLSRVR
jgi:hypothetical protein